MLSRAVPASPAVVTQVTACVLDGIMVTSDGHPITLAGPRHVDLAPYGGKKIRVTGELHPGDVLFPTADLQVLGACSAAEKLTMLEVLARVYRKQADRDSAPAARPAPAKASRRPPIDCPGGKTCYQIVRVPKAGGAATVIRSAPLVGHVFVDKEHVYWSEGTVSGWQMMKQRKVRGTPSPVARGALRGAMVRGERGFYGIVDGGLAALEDGKPPRMLVSGASNEVAIDGDRIYYADYGPENSTSLASMPLAGGARQTLAAGQPVSTTLFVANGELYWANINVPPVGGGQILRVPVGGGVVRTVVETKPKMTPWALAADARSVYWVEWTRTGYALYRAPKDGGDRTLLGEATATVMNRDNRDHIELDGTHVYWNAREGVARVAKAGGTVEDVVRLARGDVMSFAIDETDVYLAAVFF